MVNLANDDAYIYSSPFIHRQMSSLAVFGSRSNVLLYNVPKPSFAQYLTRWLSWYTNNIHQVSKRQLTRLKIKITVTVNND